MSDEKYVGTAAAAKQVVLIKTYVDSKLKKAAVATPTANGLMSAADKTKLDGVEDGATKTIVDDAMSDTSTNPVQNKVVMKYIDSRGTLPPVSTQNDNMLIQVVDGAYALRTKESIFPVDDALDTESKNAVENGIIARRFEQLSGLTLPATSKRDGLMSASDFTKLSGIEAGANKTVVDAALDETSTNPVQNKAVKTALDGKAGTAVATTSANGLMSSADKTKLDGVEAGANKTTVDAALDAASENPVQNKAVKAALDGKLSTLGGEISGHLSVGLTVSAEGSVSTGRTSTDTGIHFEKAGSDVGRISHGSDPMTGVSPIARLKVASPTEDDDAATKAYVDGRAVRYDAAQTLDEAQQFQARKNIGAVGNDSPQFQGYVTLTPADGILGHGVGLSPSGSGYDYTLNISEVDTQQPTKLTGVKTPTDADTNAAATVEYVKAKVASGGVTDAVLYTAQTLTDTQKKQARANIDAASDFVVNGTVNSDRTVTLDKTFAQIQTAIQDGKQPVAKISNANATVLLPLASSSATAVTFMAGAYAGEDIISFDYLSLTSSGQVSFNEPYTLAVSPSGTIPQITMAAAPTEDMEIATKQYVDNSVASTPLTLTYASGQATGASYSDIRKAIESGRQIKLSVANTPDIIAANARNETNKSVLKFIHTDVGGDTVNIAQYTVTAQASGLTVHVKSREIA